MISVVEFCERESTLTVKDKYFDFILTNFHTHRQILSISLLRKQSFSKHEMRKKKIPKKKFVRNDVNVEMCFLVMNINLLSNSELENVGLSLI